MYQTDAAARQAKSLALLSTVVIATVLIAALYVAREILLPFALSILLSFLLTPVVERLERIGMPRIPSVVLVVASSFCGILFLSYVLAQQLYDLAYRMPEYKSNIISKGQAFRTHRGGVLERLEDAIKGVQFELSKEPQPDPNQPKTANQYPALTSSGQADHKAISTLPRAKVVAGETQPVPVEVVNRLTVQEVASGIVAPIVAPLGTAMIVVIFLVFMLIEREDLRNRFIRLIGSHQLSATTQALDDAAQRVSRYLLMQLIINGSYGVTIAIGLSLIGLPNALLWGALTAILRFVPYVGAWIAITIPMTLSLAVFEGWTEPALVFALYITCELIVNNVMEPWLYGASTGISTMGILVSAVFWTWIWGPVGLVMATPLTVCLTVVGRYVPQLAFLNTLLSDQQVLPPKTRFYQRLLAGDTEEAISIAEEYIAAEHSIEQTYDDVLLPSLCLAQSDFRRGDLDETRLRFILQAVREFVEALEMPVRTAAEAHVDSAAARPIVLCLPARDDTDEVAALMLSKILESRGFDAPVTSTKALASEMLDQVAAFDVDAVCVSAVPPFASSTSRYLVKRLRQKFPKLRIVAGLWREAGEVTSGEKRIAASGVDRIEFNLASVSEELTRLIESDRLLDRGESAEVSEPSPHLQAPLIRSA